MTSDLGDVASLPPAASTFVTSIKTSTTREVDCTMLRKLDRIGVS
jgi:hypothetical protein